jgi:phytoene dehydrogenase-like protein
MITKSLGLMGLAGGLYAYCQPQQVPSVAEE